VEQLDLEDQMGCQVRRDKLDSLEKWDPLESRVALERLETRGPLVVVATQDPRETREHLDLLEILVPLGQMAPRELWEVLEHLELQVGKVFRVQQGTLDLLE